MRTLLEAITAFAMGSETMGIRVKAGLEGTIEAQLQQGANGRQKL